MGMEVVVGGDGVGVGDGVCCLVLDKGFWSVVGSELVFGFEKDSVQRF